QPGTEPLHDHRAPPAVVSRHPEAAVTAEPRPPLRILIADDQQDVLEALRLLLKAEGFQIETARSVAGILSAVETHELDAVLMDLNYTRDTTSGREGLDILPKIQA